MAFPQTSKAFLGLVAILLTAPLSTSAAVLLPRQDDEFACWHKSPKMHWEVTNFISWGGDYASPSKGLSFHILNAATGYNTDCTLSIEPAKEPECGQIRINYDGASSNITVSQRWNCKQPNWPTDGVFFAEGSHLVELGGCLDAVVGAKSTKPACSYPDFNIDPSRMTAVA